jgi:plasmid stabilization system protein ParE
MVQVEWTQHAIARLESVKEYLSKTNSAAAKLIIEEIYNRTQRLTTFPRMGHEVSAPHDREI